MLRYPISIALFFFMAISYSQNIITDTLHINFIADSIIPFDVPINEINDMRLGSKKFISYSATKKFVLLPVDQEVSTKNTLSVELTNSFNTIDTSAPGYILEINHFEIERYNGLFYSPFVLQSDIPVYYSDKQEKKFIGTLSYNFEYKPAKRKTKKTETCEFMLNNWHRNLKLDLLQTNSYLNSGTKKPENLILKKIKKTNYLNLNIASVSGINFWQVEGEIFFTRPETKKNNRFVSNIIRYQNNADFEMIAYGKKAEHFTNRFNDNWQFDISSNILLGLNKWRVKDDKTLYQLVNLSVSSNQCLVFNKSNRSSWILKAGLFENLYYIIGMQPKLQLGLNLGFGYKF